MQLPVNNFFYILKILQETFYTYHTLNLQSYSKSNNIIVQHTSNVAVFLRMAETPVPLPQPNADGFPAVYQYLHPHSVGETLLHPPSCKQPTSTHCNVW